jgi:hypothetical protein
MVVYACSQYAGREAVKPETKSQLTTSSNYCIPNNVTNVQDSVGIIHNEILVQTLGWPSVDSCLAQANEIAIGRVVNAMPNFQTYLLNTDDVLAIVADSINNFQTIVSNTSYGTEARNALNSLFSILLDTTDTTVIDYCILKEKILNLENSVSNNNSINNNEKVLILSASSVARHSSFFWMNQFKNENGNTPPSYAPMKKEWWKKFWRGLFIGACDVAGGVAGGAALAASANPFVIGCGAFAGAVGVSSAGKSLWD